MRVALLKPKSGLKVIPTSLCCLAASLRKAGYEPSIYDVEVHGDWERRLREFAPDLVGITVASYTEKSAGQLIGRIRTSIGATIVVGGPHVTIVGEPCLSVLGADFAIMGEGERPLVQLCHALSGKATFEYVGGLLYREGAATRRNPGEAIRADLEDFPFPAWDLIDLDEYGPLPVVISRGCPYSCTFCSVPNLEGRRMRYRSPESAVDEIQDAIRRHGTRDFAFVGDNILPPLVKGSNTSDTVLAQICDLLVARDVRIRWGLTGVRADAIDERILQKIRTAGCVEFGFGVESGSEAVLKRMKKSEGIADIERAIKMAKAAGFVVGASVIVGSPGDSLAAVKETARLIERTRPNKIYVNLAVAYPGTELYNWVHSEGRLTSQGDPAYPPHLQSGRIVPQFDTEDFTAEERVRAYRWIERRARWSMVRTNLISLPQLLRLYGARECARKVRRRVRFAAQRTFDSVARRILVARQVDRGVAPRN